MDYSQELCTAVNDMHANLVTIFHTWNGKQSTSLGTAEETDQAVKAEGCSWFESSVPEELKVDEDTDCEVVWAKVKIRSSSDLYIGSFYRPPDKTNLDYLQHLYSCIFCIPTDKGAHLWLSGDFNLPGVDWQ